MDRGWIVVEHSSVTKQLQKLPHNIVRLYHRLVLDLANEGPRPLGWNVASLAGTNQLRIRLNREYRVIVEVRAPYLMVLKAAHRKDAYR